MPRRMTPEREREYAELHAYIDCFSTYVLGIDQSDPAHPTNAGKEIVAEFGKSKALQGLKQAANDTVEQFIDASPNIIEDLNSLMRDREVITFSEICRRYARQYQRILKKGAIKFDTEFYLVTGVLADVSLDTDSDERAKLEHLIAEYKNDG